MTLILSGTDGLSDVDGSAATPAIRGTDANTGIFFPAADTIAFSEGGVESMRITPDGNVGIGTASPNASYKMSITGNSASIYSGILFTDTNAGGGVFSIYGESAALKFRDSSAGATRMVIDSSGNVGIGTSSPSSYSFDSGVDLVVGDGTNSAVSIVSSTTGTGYLAFADGTSGTARYSGMLEYSHTSNFLGFRTSATEAMRIDSSGNLLVGTTTAGVQNNISTTIENSGLNNARITVNHSSSGSSNGSYFMQFAYGGTLSGGIGQASTTTVNFYTGPSDRRLKNNIEDLDSSGEFIDALQPRKWVWATNGESDVGFVADELQAVLPRCVNGEPNAVDEDGKPVYQMVDTSPPEMIANIVAELKAIRKREKEQQALIQTLTDRITALEQA